MPRTNAGGPFWAGIDGVSLTGDGGSMAILDIRESVKESSVLLDPGRYEGQREILHTRESLSVTIVIHIRSRDPGERREALRYLANVKKTGWLRTNIRPERILWGTLTGVCMPEALGFAPMELTFTAHDFPYWRSDGKEIFRDTGQTLQHTFVPEGTAERSFLEVYIANTEGEALQRVEIETTSGGWLSCMAFTGLNLSPSDPLTLAYDGRHRLYIRAGTGDAQGFRTAVSSDDLLLVPGQANTVRIVADRKCLVSLMAPGIYR